MNINKITILYGLVGVIWLINGIDSGKSHDFVLAAMWFAVAALNWKSKKPE